MQVLLVEDDALVRACLADLLSEAGLHVAAAANATEALDLVAQEIEAPAVLVADVHLGAGMDGLRLAAAARHRWPGIGAVLISGDIGIADRVSGPSDRFLTKPFEAAALVQAIREVGGRYPG